MGFSFKVTRKHYALYVVRDVFKVVTEDAKTPPFELVLLFFLLSLNICLYDSDDDTCH